MIDIRSLSKPAVPLTADARPPLNIRGRLPPSSRAFARHPADRPGTGAAAGTSWRRFAFPLGRWSTARRMKSCATVPLRRRLAECSLGCRTRCLYEIIETEQLSGTASAPPDEADCRCALARRSWIQAGHFASNAPFPAEMMLRQAIERSGGLSLDAVVFSSEVGLRKPAAGCTAALLRSWIQVAPSLSATVARDFEGPQAIGPTKNARRCSARRTPSPGRARDPYDRLIYALPGLPVKPRKRPVRLWIFFYGRPRRVSVAMAGGLRVDRVLILIFAVLAAV